MQIKKTIVLVVITACKNTESVYQIPHRLIHRILLRLLYLLHLPCGRLVVEASKKVLRKLAFDHFALHEKVQMHSHHLDFFHCHG